MVKFVLASWLVLNASPNLSLEKSLENHGWGRVTYESRLADAARELGQIIAHSESGIDPDALGQRLAFTLARHHVVDAQFVPFTVGPISDPDIKPLIPTLLSRLNHREPPTHYGHFVYSSDDKYFVTILLIHRGAALSGTLPRKASLDENVHIVGRLERGYYQPRLIVHSPLDGFTEQPDDRHGRNFGFEFGFEHGPGPYRLEVVAGSQYGPVVLVQHTIHVQQPVPKLPLIKLHPRTKTGTANAPVTRMLELINSHRVIHGLPPLNKNTDLMEIAQGHAEELSKRQSLSHASPESGTLTTRVRKRGLAPALVAENLANASSPEAAFRSFQGSPGHARNLLIDDLTDVGVGHIGRYFVVTLASILPKKKRLR